MLFTVEILIVRNGVIQQIRSFSSGEGVGSQIRITDKHLCKFSEMDFFCRARSALFPLQPMLYACYTALMCTDMGNIVVTNMLIALYYYIQMTNAPNERL